MLNLIVAPFSHNPNGERYAKRIVKYLKSQQTEYAVYFFQSIEKIKEEVKELISIGETDFVAIGDDVIVNAIITNVKDLSKIRLGVVPTNKNDDFARYLKLSSNPIQAIKDILLNKVDKIDLLDVNGMTVVNNIVVGASVEVFHMYSQYKFQNVISEKIATKKYGNTFSGIELVVDTNGKTKKENVFELVVANGGFSKGKPVSPLSNMQDGLFNLAYTVVRNESENKKYIKKFNNGEHVYDDNTKQSWLTNVKISNPDKKIKAIVDGKIMSFEELNISILEKVLKIFKR